MRQGQARLTRQLGTVLTPRRNFMGPYPPSMLIQLISLSGGRNTHPHEADKFICIHKHVDGLAQLIHCFDEAPYSPHSAEAALLSMLNLDLHASTLDIFKTTDRKFLDLFWTQCIFELPQRPLEAVWIWPCHIACRQGSLCCLIPFSGEKTAKIFVN